jgi:hypothetical protein
MDEDEGEGEGEGTDEGKMLGSTDASNECTSASTSTAPMGTASVSIDVVTSKNSPRQSFTTEVISPMVSELSKLDATHGASDEP